MGEYSLTVKLFLICIYSLYVIYLSYGQNIGRECTAPNNCPFRECAEPGPNGTGYICICRLAHMLESGLWATGYENCTTDYSPWSLYPYEDGVKVPDPLFDVEKVPDDRLTASDAKSPNFAKYGRLYSQKGWCVQGGGTTDYFQVDLGSEATVAMIGHQGAEGKSILYSVLSFKVQISADDVAWTVIMDQTNITNERLFVGNTYNNDDVIYNYFDPPITARYLRIYPITFQTKKCLRLEVFGSNILNECTTPGIAQCSVDADCINTISGYICKCHDGYADASGNGFVCGEVNECTETNPVLRHNCSRFADCTNKVGGFKCQCRSGYDGDGYYCEDHNECTDIIIKHDCHSDAFCNNTGGDYSCNCKPGYSGNGNECEDIDECKKGLSNCHHDAFCTNIPGSFQCQCYGGYIGNGVECEDENECLFNPSPCHSDATCTNLKGTHKCVCSAGFDGNGVWCEDINECDTDNGGCTADERCINYRGRHHCMCPAILPVQYSYNKLERTILDQVLLNFRDVTKEDWRYPMDHHAHTMRTIYQLVMRTYNYHFLEVRDPFSITKVAGDAFAVELYDLRCKDIANLTFPSLCNPEYKETKFDGFSDIVEMWLVRKPERLFETWATAPPPIKPNPNGPTTTAPPIITDRPLTEQVININGTNFTFTEAPRPVVPMYANCGGILTENTIEREFTSPNYTYAYPPNSNCVWEIRAPARHNIFVSFDVENFETEYDKKCVYDFVEIRDGSLTGDLLGKYCGKKDQVYPKGVRSGRETLFLIFKSDKYHQYKGFRATWGILSPRVSIGCITYNQMSTMPNSYIETWRDQMEFEDKSTYVPVARLMACRQFPQCNNSRPGPIRYTFEHFRVDRNIKMCIRWDLDTIGATYSTSGCKKVKTNKTHTVCECNTWGIVGVLGKFNEFKPPAKLSIFELGKNTFFSVLLVILGLIVTLAYLFLKDNWGDVVIHVFTKKEFDSGRMIQMHIVMSALLAEIFFSIISFNVTAKAGICFFLGFIFYYLLQTVFFWLFIYALFLQSRVQEIFDSEKYNSYRIYLIVGYGVPLFVTLTISGLNFKTDLDQHMCWLLFQGTTVWGFSGVIVTLGVGTLLILLNIIYSARSVENGRILQDKCMKAMFTTFFVLLTAAYGARTLQEQKFYTEYLFSLFNLLQGFSIPIMYCVLRREDPIIKSNQVGPIPEFDEGEDSFDESDSDEGGKDMSEAPSSNNSEDEEIEDMDDINGSQIRNSAILVEVKEAEPDEDETMVDGPAEEQNFDDSTDSDEDQEIMFRTGETEDYVTTY